MDGQFSVTQKYKSEILLDNEDIMISYFRTARIKKDEFGQKIFSNLAKLIVGFKSPIDWQAVFENLRKIETVFGFAFNRKLSLLEMKVIDFTGIYHDLIPHFQKNFKDIILDDFHIVDLNTKNLLKDVLKTYYSNVHIASVINMYYEYI